MADVGIIGAGVSGLYAALVLRRLGHTVTVLEAKPRAGGLSTTVRRGDVIVEVDESGRVAHQTAGLDAGLYVNAGPGRFPHHHRRILGLCRELGVALEPYLMSTDANYYVDARSGERFRRRRLEHDTRGWVAEFAYPLMTSPQERSLVSEFGDLDPDGRYRGSERAGSEDPVPFGQLTRLKFWQHRFSQPVTHLWQAAMFQPVGGMDHVWRAMLAEVSDAVLFNAPVHYIATSDRSVEVAWRRHGQVAGREFNWVLSTVPFPHLAAMRLRGFPTAWREAVQIPGFAPAVKVGWQAESRWWESDAEMIYGGISYTDDLIQQFWYPSTGHHSSGPATLTGAYAAYEAAWRLGQLPPARRIDRARRGGAKIHPEVASEELVPTSKAVTVAWHKVPYQAGGWCHWDPSDPSHEQAYAALTSPAGRFVAIGDQASSLPGWHEGCLESVDRAVGHVENRTVPPEVSVPDSRRLTVDDHPDVDSFIDVEGDEA